MAVYVDTSAMFKHYVIEPGSDDCDSILRSDTEWVSAHHAFVEIQHALGRLLRDADLAEALDVFIADWERVIVIELDQEIYARAAEFSITLGVRTLDALHLAAAQRAGGASLPFLTFDARPGAGGALAGLDGAGGLSQLASASPTGQLTPVPPRPQ